MQQRLKQRLIGAAVLTALAVIFLPMLLTGPVEQRRVDVPIEVPPRPEVTPSAELPDAGFAQQPAPGQNLAEQPPQREPEPQSEPAPGPEEPVASMQQAPPENEAASLPETEPVTPGADTAPTSPESDSDTAAADSAEAEAAVPDESGNWAVQVGGFRGSDNAQRLRDRLRDAGFTVYVDETQLDGEPLYRVKLGPVVERADAEALAQRVQDEQDLKGLVIAQ